jgi:hypothetical protein
MGSFHPADKFAGVPAHRPLDHYVHPTQVDGGSESEINPAPRSDSVELEKEAEDDRKAEAAEDAHMTADYAPGLEATLDQDMWARDHGHTYHAGAYQLGESLPATLRSGSSRPIDGRRINLYESTKG